MAQDYLQRSSNTLSASVKQPPSCQRTIWRGAFNVTRILALRRPVAVWAARTGHVTRAVQLEAFAGRACAVQTEACPTAFCTLHRIL